MSWIFPLFSLACSNSSVPEHRTWRDILKGHCILSPPLVGTTSYYSFHKILSSSVLDMFVFFFPLTTARKPVQNLMLLTVGNPICMLGLFMGFLISIFSCSTVVTSLRFVLLTGKLALSNIYSHHVLPSFYFTWLNKPCSFNVLYMHIRLPVPLITPLWLNQSDFVFQEERLEVYTVVP